MSPNQFGFKPRNSCINQLLSITLKNFQSFDEGLEIRSVFLYFSNKEWNKGLIFKPSQNWISGNLINILSDLLNERTQRVALIGQKFACKNVNAGVPQGSIPEPLLFLIYINDLSGDLSSKAKLLADDTSPFNAEKDINTSENELNIDLKKVSKSTFQWKPNQHFSVRLTRCINVVSR